MLMMLSLVPPASAQLPAGFDLAPPRDQRWVVADVEATRFPVGTAPAPGPSLRAGDEVVVVLFDGDHVRITKGQRYGWVALSALTDVAPKTIVPSSAPGLLTQPLLATPQVEDTRGGGMGAGPK